ncbi:hypothetical protein RYX36_023511, partial [Vicia faba]
GPDDNDAYITIRIYVAVPRKCRRNTYICDRSDWKLLEKARIHIPDSFNSVNLPSNLLWTPPM